MTEYTRHDPTMVPFGHARAPRRRESSSKRLVVLLLVLALALAAAAAWFWSLRPVPQETLPFPARSEAPAVPVPGAAVQALPAAPIAPEPATLVRAGEFADALMELLGRDAVLRFLETTNLPRTMVATLDNLARDHAPVMAWPVVPTPGRFATQSEGSVATIGPENAARYAPFVSFIESIDAKSAVDLYRRMYPTLQSEYRELGFTDRTLHTRLFEVINLLLATPEPGQTPRVVQVQVKGPIPSTQPWTRYEFEQLEFERLAAGQKILLRVGPENRQVLKAKLEEIRLELLQSSMSAGRP